MILKYGTRGSKLALHQTRYAVDILKKSSDDVEFEEVIIKTLGDKVTGLPLFKVGGQGLFIKEIEQALLEKRIDIAVHSFKDVPSVLAKGLTIVAVGGAKDPRDCFISISDFPFNGEYSKTERFIICTSLPKKPSILTKPGRPMFLYISSAISSFGFTK